VLALDDVSLVCTQGNVLALLGESGSGKSTVLRVLTGLVQPDNGEVHIAGVRLTSAAAPRETLESLRLRIGYVIQEGGLFPHLSAEENVLLTARHQKYSAPQMQQRLQELLAMMQLPDDILRRYPTELSGGQRQRIALMRALMLKPEVLLLDEPFSALDPLIRRDLQREVLAIIRSLGVTTLLVTHDVTEAQMFTRAEGDTLAVMRFGRVVQQGAFATLASAPVNDFVRDFLSIGAVL
jgi:osmoprotectant transport system ATP-binding protein